MAVDGDIIHDLESVVADIFPGSHLQWESRESRRAAQAADIVVELPESKFRLWIEVVSPNSRAQLTDAAEHLRLMSTEARGAVPVLASSYFSPPRQQLLREKAVAFLDLAGNAWIMGPGIHVDRRGFGNPNREDRGQRDVFSDRASLILRVLMMEQSPMGVRQIAERASSELAKTQLSPGYVSKIVGELERRGYVARRDEKVVLRRADELLKEWIFSYRKHRRRPREGLFIPAAEAESLMPRIAEAFDRDGVDYVFALQAGASLVDRYADFDVVDVYVRDEPIARRSLERIGARAVERGGNVNLIKPYYGMSAFYDYQSPGQGRMKAASDIQLYLDLYDYPVRGREQAEHLYDRRLRRHLERTDAL